jgi:hypothetical protein
MVHCRQPCSLSRSIESSQLGVPQGEGAVAPFHIGTGTLAHLGELFGLLLALALLSLMQPGQPTPGLKQRRAQTLSPLPKWLPGMHHATLGHTLERERGHERGVQGMGHRRAQGKWSDLLVHRA